VHSIVTPARGETPKRFDIVEELAEDDLQESPAPEPGLVTVFHPELASESDDGLVTYMAFKSTDEALARAACEELHRRHARFLLGWCISKRKETFGDSAESFVNHTFMKAYEHAANFICTDQSQAKEQVLAWLFRILGNLYLDSLRGEKKRPVVHGPKGGEEWLENIVEKDQEQRKSAQTVPTARKAAILAFLESLPPKDREILTVTAEFWNHMKGEPDIDPEIREGICRDYGLTESSLRVRRKRLKERAIVFIKERTK
jgi:DNA-directed RNA polymerase specialized sigma24 family protein